MRRALLAATLAAAALLPVAPASASCHAICLFDGEPICAFHPICDDIAEILERIAHGGDTR